MKYINFKNYISYYFTKQFIFFLFAGSFAALVNFTSRILLRPYMDIILSAVMSYCLGLITAFILYRILVFPFSVTPLKLQARRFLTIQLCCMPVVIIIFVILADSFKFIGLGEYSEPIAHFISIGLPALITFILYKLIVFVK